MQNLSVPVVGFCGGRNITAKWLPLAARVGRGAVAAGLQPAVGCCVGADALIMSAGLIGGWADKIEVLAAFGPDGAGAISSSALSLVQLVQAAGAPIHWWAGGGPTIPVAARLVRRTAALAGYTGGHEGAPMIGFVGDGCPREVRPRLVGTQSPTGAGSWTALSMAAGRQRQIFVFWCAGGAPDLPAHWGGEWQQGPSGNPGGWLVDAWQWMPPAEQPKLF